MKRRVQAARACALALLLLLPLQSAAAVAAPAEVWVEGRPLRLPVPPLMAGGHLLAPVRPLAELLGYRVAWDPDRRAALLARRDRTIRLQADRAWAVIAADGSEVVTTMLVPARVRRGHLLAPLRPLLQLAAPGARVTWDGARRRAHVDLARGGGPTGPSRSEPTGPGRGGGSTGGTADGARDGGVRPPEREADRDAEEGRGGEATPQRRPARFVVLSYYTEEEHPDAPEGAYASLRRFGHRISALAGFFARLQVDRFGNATGALEPMAPAPYEVRRRVVETAHRQGMPVYLLVHNLLYPGGPEVGRRAAHQVMARPELRAKVIAHILEILRREGYDGVNVDFEGIAAADRDAYTEFVRQLARALKPAGYAVTLSVPAKVADHPAHAWGYPYDYAALGELADYVAVMTYDYHGYATGPGPIAPLDWVLRVAAYARATMPPERVLLGIAAHAFDWPLDGGSPRYLGAREALSLARVLGIHPSVDPMRGATFRYRDPQGRLREVWFETAETAAAKVAAAEALGLGGIALWRLGFEDPRLWTVIEAAVPVATGLRPSASGGAGAAPDTRAPAPVE